MNKQLSTLLQKEMTRKEFLATLGLGIASIFGFGSLIRLLTGKQDPLTQQTATPANYGYGASVYGGRHN